jgi:hypothetical protein
MQLSRSCFSMLRKFQNVRLVWFGLLFPSLKIRHIFYILLDAMNFSLNIMKIIYVFIQCHMFQQHNIRLCVLWFQYRWLDLGSDICILITILSAISVYNDCQCGMINQNIHV